MTSTTLTSTTHAETASRATYAPWPPTAPVSPEEATPLGLVSLVIPAMNEELNVAWVLSQIPAVVDEVVLVDGHSIDNTVAVAREAFPGIVIVTQEGRGKGAALRTGFAAARGEFVVMIDADGSMDPTEIKRYVAKLRAGYDFVKGSRYMDGGGSTDLTGLRSFGNRFLMGMVNALYGARFTDLCYGYCGFSRRGLRALDLDADGFEIETQIAVRALMARLAIAEVPTFETERMNGTSNLNTFRDGQRVLRTLLGERLRWRPRLTQPDTSVQVEAGNPAMP